MLPAVAQELLVQVFQGNTDTARHIAFQLSAMDVRRRIINI
jgi:hypothetical protein